MSADRGPNMEIRAFVAVALSLVVMLGYQYFFVPPPQVPPAGNETGAAAPLEPQVAEGAPPSIEQPDAATGEPLGAEADPVTAPEGAPATPVESTDIVAEREQSVLIETERYRMVVSNRGALITDLELVDWRGDFGGAVQMIVEQLAPGNAGWFKLVSPDEPAEAERANRALYRMTVNGGEPLGTVRVTEPTEVRWLWAEGDRRVEKVLTLTPDSYLTSLRVSAQTPMNNTFFLTVGPGLEAHADTSRVGIYLMSGAVFFNQAGVEHVSAADIVEPGVLTAATDVQAPGSLTWGGLQSHYFAALFVPDGPAAVYLDAVPPPAEPAADGPEDGVAEARGGEPGTRALFGVQVPPAGFEMPLYMGPKSFGPLQAAGHDLERAVDYGMFRVLARPVALTLEWLYGFVGNYGIAIILATLGVRLLFFPLSQSSMKSMRRMQQLQPQMNAIRNRYKGVKDMEKRQQMNTEVMQLYKDNNVSPLGGCVPMLLQMPVLFGFYAAISVSIDIRQAPFVLWIQDLSKMDPFYVLPLLMGASMFLQQRMSPGTGDPVQQRIFRLMPIMFTFFFLTFPSGLVLYWLLNTVLGIAQQYYVNHQLGPAEATSTPNFKPASKKGKKGGGGKRKKRGK